MDALQGFQPIIGELGKLIDEYLPKGSLAFNITGGYKGAIPSITSICIARQLGCPMYYMHESQSAVIRVDFPASRKGLASETAYFVPPQHIAS
jgi:CRISPR-associated protein (Cas_APE2256)